MDNWKDKYQETLSLLKQTRKKLADYYLTLEPNKFLQDLTNNSSDAYKLLLSSNINKTPLLTQQEQQIVQNIIEQPLRHPKALQHLFIIMLYTLPNKLPAHWQVEIKVPDWVNEYIKIWLGNSQITKNTNAKQINSIWKVVNGMPIVGMPKDFELAPIVGASNDYSFIEDKLQKFITSEKQYSLAVSIIIPVYNRKQVLAKTLAALTHQTYPKNLIEIIIADDGSSDGVEEVITKYKQYLNLNYVYQEDKGYRLNFSREKLLTNMIIGHFRIFRKSDFARTSGYNPNLINAVDYEFFMRLSEICHFKHINVFYIVIVGMTKILL